MNAPAVPQTFHAWDNDGNYCTVCNLSLAEITFVRQTAGVCFCVPIAPPSEGGDAPETESPNDETTIDPYFLYACVRV